MLHSIHDINPARLNAIMPTLQRMEDDPAFLEYRERRFNQDEPPPYSSHSTTRLPTPDLFPPTADDIDVDELLRKPLSDYEINLIRGRFKRYHPRDRYDDEVRQEKKRIDDAYSRRDANYIPLYRGPDLIGRPGQQREYIMARHSIKKRWQQLGVWNPEWGVPTDELGGFGNDDGPYSWAWDRKPRYIKRKFNYLPHEEKMASWPSPDEETPNERAIRLHLSREGRWSETLKLQSSEAGKLYDVDADDRESLIMTRPWYVWALEVAEEEVRLNRDPKQSLVDVYYPARANVTARWKEKGYWKDSWSKNALGNWMGDLRDLPGWKWRHESPSPEPPDPNDMEFTPSEIDALEAIRPPTPPSPPRPSSLQPRGPTWSKIFGLLPGYDPDPAPPTYAQPTSKPYADGDGDDEGNRPGATAEPIGGESAQRLRENGADMAPCAEQGGLFPSVQHHADVARPTMTVITASNSVGRPRVEIASPVARKTRLGQQASRAPAKPSNISKPTPAPRRSPRIAERERRLNGIGVSSETVKAVDKENLTLPPWKELSPQTKETLTRATKRKKDRVKERHPLAPSKPQGVAKRRGRSRRLNA
ncbi:uncharacterized protein Z518_01851 [Rhinocladiella mackenziei CBS 650.93]|uniref:Uncharacterized protein n=1 Tax=Rhinocladiella mackenziei CBS 650.93 TaxID=1442369 RepID=A0A0D2H9N3_9EURO|nr:uncharacterized protein Z518_01851 [Rhinocladiella mackenziei CBS 650.93]KIX07198.1 hypothetical protein Z518_01851 [Rhinocladiella mackenziei CBS 650.93]